MEGTAGPVLFAFLFQWYARVDDFNDIDPVEQVVDEGAGNSTCHAG
jgi:hypothetical protein